MEIEMLNLFKNLDRLAEKEWSHKGKPTFKKEKENWQIISLQRLGKSFGLWKVKELSG